MTVQIKAKGVSGDLDLTNLEARNLLCELGLSAGVHLDLTFNSSAIAERCESWMRANGVETPAVPPALQRPTSDEIAGLVIGVRHLALNSTDGKIRFR